MSFTVCDSFPTDHWLLITDDRSLITDHWLLTTGHSLSGGSPGTAHGSGELNFQPGKLLFYRRRDSMFGEVSAMHVNTLMNTRAGLLCKVAIANATLRLESAQGDAGGQGDSSISLPSEDMRPGTAGILPVS